MADCITVMSQADISILTDMLQAQQKLLQRLHSDLEAERDSSSSAAKETLSVILRLQEEKAAIKMESEQYKRLVEEKMRHAEKSMAINDDIIYQKEMQVSALSYQVQAYYHKLLSFGCVDDDVDELRYTKNFLQRNEALASDKIVPVLPKFNDTNEECTSNNSLEMNCADEIHVEDGNGDEIYEKSLDVEKTDNSATGSINSLNCASLLSDSKELIDEIKCSANVLQSGSAVDYHCSTNVYDVYEVPQIDRNLEFHELVTSGQKETDHDRVHPQAVNLYTKDEYDGLKKISLQFHCDGRLCKPSDISATDCRITGSEPSTSDSASRPRLNQLERESEINEVETERLAEVTNTEEEIKLLNEIKEQLNSIRDDIRRSKVKKRSVMEEPSLRLLSEAMIYFWL